MDDLLYCNFCGRSQNEARVFISGPAVFICDDCVLLCAEIVEERLKELEKENSKI